MIQPRTKAYLYLLLTTAIWGIAGPVIKYTLGSISPLLFLTYRFGISTVFGLIFLIATKSIGKAERENFWGVIWYGLITTTFSLGLLFAGIQKTTAIEASLLTSIIPFVVAIFGSLTLGETVTRKEKLGMLIAFFGTVITLVDPLIKGAGGYQFKGNVLVLIYVVGIAISAVSAKKLLRKGIDPLVLTNISFIVGFASLLPIAILKSGTFSVIENIKTLSLPYHLGVFYMALVSGNLAYWLWIKAQKTIEVSEAGVFEYLIPIFAAPLAIFWLRESVSILFIAGAAAITAGVFVAEYKGKVL